MPKKLTQIDFINKSNLIHNNKFDYTLVKYNGILTKIKIICPIHGEFEQLPKNHLNGFGCVKCRGKFKITLGRFIFFSHINHNFKYNYSLVILKNMRSKVKIICPIHGIFEQTINNHLKGCGCPSCGGVKIPTTEEFILNANKIHNNKYDYSLTKYKSSKTYIKIICQKHGLFKQNPTNHISGQGCPICLESQGEKKVDIYLTNNNIKYERQYTFKNCKYKKLLPFDFYLPEYNICIEYDGIQHFESIEFWGGQTAFESQKKRDKIKTDYCNNNNIKLIRIKYNDNIIEKLEKLDQ